MSAKKPGVKKAPVKTIYAASAGSMPVLRPAGVEAKPEAETEMADTARALQEAEANRAVILRLVEAVKGL